MNFTWNDAKRQATLKKNRLDFAEALRVFAIPDRPGQGGLIVLDRQHIVGSAITNGLCDVGINGLCDASWIR